MRMNFGTYAGRALDDVPEDYLRWALCNCHRIDQRLREAIRAKLGIDVSRSKDVDLESIRRLNLIRDLIRDAYREVLVKYGFDGENPVLPIEAMDDFHDEIKKILTEQLGSA